MQTAVKYSIEPKQTDIDITVKPRGNSQEIPRGYLKEAPAEISSSNCYVYSNFILGTPGLKSGGSNTNTKFEYHIRRSNSSIKLLDIQI